MWNRLSLYNKTLLYNVILLFQLSSSNETLTFAIKHTVGSWCRWHVNTLKTLSVEAASEHRSVGADFERVTEVKRSMEGRGVLQGFSCSRLEFRW